MITSTTNSHVKYIRSLLANRRERQQMQSFVLEGVQLVAEALSAQAPLHLILYAPKQLGPDDQQLLAQLATFPNSYEATPQVIKAATDTVSPQGVVAVCGWIAQPPKPGLWLILDEIQDPGNMGTLLRSAEAVGVGQVLCTPGCVDLYNPKVVRSAMGAHFYLSLRTQVSWDELADILRHVPHIYAAVAKSHTPYYTIDWRKPAALIIGNEAHGIHPHGVSLATETIAIPMQGHLESLNAAMAGSVILFEVLRQKMVQ